MSNSERDVGIIHPDMTIHGDTKQIAPNDEALMSKTEYNEVWDILDWPTKLFPRREPTDG